ncbi:MAG: alpha/beta fold hydrolase, partial [Elusimicrobiales bacterium]
MSIILSLLISTLFYAENIKLTSTDGCIISAEISVKDTKSPFLIEVHGLGSNRQEWNPLNEHLSKSNINYISLDLRGHGESTMCGKRSIKYPDIRRKDVENFTEDVKTFVRYIEEKYPQSNIIPIGASIGANIVMKLFYKKTAKIILLAPGLNYAGYEISDLFKKT